MTSQPPNPKRAQSADYKHCAPTKEGDDDHANERACEHSCAGDQTKQTNVATALPRRHELSHKTVAHDILGTHSNAHDEAYRDQPFHRRGKSRCYCHHTEDQKVELVGE